MIKKYVFLWLKVIILFFKDKNYLYNDNTPLSAIYLNFHFTPDIKFCKFFLISVVLTSLSRKKKQKVIFYMSFCSLWNADSKYFNRVWYIPREIFKIVFHRKFSILCQTPKDHDIFRKKARILAICIYLKLAR